MTDFLTLLWTTPTLLLAAFIVGWATEAAQLFISQSLALAILAWLQTLPEFAVEAQLAWSQSQSLMLANLTGSVRLLVGFGWPLIYFIHALSTKQFWPVIRLKKRNGLEVVSLFVSALFFCWIIYRGQLSPAEGGALIILYGIFIWRLKSQTSEAREERTLPRISQMINAWNSKVKKIAGITGLFLIGGILLKVTVHPFLQSLEAMALILGISQFYFIQWCAPFVSEFPENLTAARWALSSQTVTTALLNLISSNIVQWTAIAGVMPLIFSASKRQWTTLVFDSLQLQELKLTIAQSFLAITFLLDLEMDVSNAFGLFLLWLVQFVFPSTRGPIMIVYGLWGFVEILRLLKNKKLSVAFEEVFSRKERV